MFLNLLKNIQSHRFLALLSPSNCTKNPLSTFLISSNSSELSVLSSISRRPFSLSAHFTKPSVGKIQKKPELVPLSGFFRGAVVDPNRRVEDSGVEAEDGGENAASTCFKKPLVGMILKNSEPLSVFFRRAVDSNRGVEDSGIEVEDEGENAELKDKLRNLEEQVRSLSKEGCGEGRALKLKRDAKVKTEAKRSLSGLFGDEKTKKVVLLKPMDMGNEDPTVYKELSPDMEMLTCHLYMEGYLKDASFLRRNKFDMTSFQVSYAREFLKFAAMKFAKDHQEITKWLSASDLKKIALFGCPSLGEKSVYAAKHLRKFFKIDEHKVCRMCKLKDSCKHTNVKFKKDATKLHLDRVTKVLIMYALESVPQQLVVPEEINSSVSRLLKEIVNLSKTKSS